MSKGEHIGETPSSEKYVLLLRELEKTFNKVIEKSPFKQRLGENPKEKLKVQRTFDNRKELIAKNTLEFQNMSKRYGKYLYEALNSLNVKLESMIEEYDLKQTLHYPSNVPFRLYKYLPFERALDVLENQHMRCGSIQYYRDNGDPHEYSILPTKSYKDVENLIEETLSDVCGDYLTLTKEYDKISHLTGDNCFAGCLSDKFNSEILWETYTESLGVCIAIDPSGFEIHKVTYLDNYEDVLNFNERVEKIIADFSIKPISFLKKSLKKMFDEFVCLSVILPFRKDCKFDKEHEWRLLFHKKDVRSKLTKEGEYEAYYFDLGGSIREVYILQTCPILSVIKNFCITHKIPYFIVCQFNSINSDISD